MPKHVLLSAVLILLCLAAAVAGRALVPQVDLIVVNPGRSPVEVRVAGDAVGVPAEGTLRLARLPRPGLRVEGPDGVERRPDAGTGSTWVWTVAPVTTWWEVRMGYGDQAHVGSSTRPFAAPGPLFPLPEDFLPVVDAPMPEGVRVKRGTTGAVRSGLWSDGYAARVAPPRVNLDVHNGTKATLRLELPDEPPLVLPPGSLAHLEGMAPQALTARAVVVDEAGDGRVYTLEAELAAAPPLAPAPTYVWDVDGATRWWAVPRRYGPGADAEPPPPPEPFEAPGPFFRLPDGFYPEVDAPFPDRWHRAEVLRVLRCAALHERRGGPPAVLEAHPHDHERPPARTPGQEGPFPPVEDGSGD